MHNATVSFHIAFGLKKILNLNRDQNLKFNWKLHVLLIRTSFLYTLSGKGLLDAQQDVLTEVICKLSHPLVDRAHNINLSPSPLTPQTPVLHDHSENISAVKVNNERLNVFCDDESTPQLTSDTLARLKETWSDSSSPSTVSIVLQSTNDVLCQDVVASDAGAVKMMLCYLMRLPHCMRLPPKLRLPYKMRLFKAASLF
jgi:hypothetical protein